MPTRFIDLLSLLILFGLDAHSQPRHLRLPWLRKYSDRKQNQAGGPQENGSRRAAGTAGARNENSGIATGAESGAKTISGEAASTDMAANWQIEQCAASCFVGGG